MGKKRDRTESGTEATPVKKAKVKGEPEERDENDESMREEDNEQDKSTITLSGLSYDEKIAFTSPIAKPMATRKLAKRLFKLVKKAAKISRKDLLRVGLKDVQMRIRKGETGIVVFAGDVTPIEVMCHLPGVCEDKGIPYVYVPFRSDLSGAVGIKRPTLMVMIKLNDKYSDLYEECASEIKLLPIPR